jgi:hypothetical protein
MGTVKCKGSQGSWEADAHHPDGHVERLACAHQHWWKNGRYSDPLPTHLRKPEKKFSRYIDLLRSTHRVILTSDSTNDQKFRGEGFFTRAGYIGVFEISDIVLDDDGLRFNFVRRIANAE